MTVAESLEQELSALRKRAPELADGPLAAAATVLARELDNAGNSATSKSMCARALRETLDRLYELAPEEKKSTRLDDLSARRTARRARGSAA